MKLAVIVGHTAADKGAKAAHLLYNEYDFNCSLAIDIYRFARESGLECQIFKRDGKTRTELGKEVNAYGGVAIELHLNAFDKTVTGTETLFDALPTDNADFAKVVHKHVIEALGRTGKRDRGTKLVSFEERGWRNLHAVTITGCLVEPIFCDNREECRLLWGHKTQYAKALVEAVLEWYCYNKEI